MPRMMRIASIGVLLGCTALIVVGMRGDSTGSGPVDDRPVEPLPEPVLAVPNPQYAQQVFAYGPYDAQPAMEDEFPSFPTVVEGLPELTEPTVETVATVDEDPAAEEQVPAETAEQPAADDADGGAETVDDGDDGDETPDSLGEETPPAVEPEPEPKRELTAAQAALRDRVRRVLAFHSQRPLSAQQNTATEIMHGCLPFGCDTEVFRSGTSGQKLNGITCLCWNYPCGGFAPLVVADGRIAARIGYGMQERPSQLLATLALARVQADYPARVGEHVSTVADLVEHEKLSCRADDDLSMKLIALSYYVDEPTWENNLGEEWSIGRIIRSEIERPILTAADGGTTRLLGLGCAVARRVESGEPIDGQFLRADKFVSDYHGYALQVQNADGSWGPRFLAAKGVSKSPVTQLRSTGHVLQWLVITLPENRLDDPQVARAVGYVTSLLGSSRYRYGVKSYGTREIGGAMRALHALAVYDRRFFKPADPEMPVEEVAKRPSR